MQLNLTIACNNAAFEEEGYYSEIARILKEVSSRFGEGETNGSIRDLNGNWVGTFELTE